MELYEKLDVTINRLGTFDVTDISDVANQCGRIGARQYKYKVAVTETSKYLDNDGFLMNNVVLHDYFSETYESKRMKCDSCEIMALTAIAYIKQYCKTHKVKGIKRIYVEIWGSDQSFIATEWKK